MVDTESVSQARACPGQQNADVTRRAVMLGAGIASLATGATQATDHHRALSELRAIIDAMRNPDPATTTVAASRDLLKFADALENRVLKFFD